MVVIFVVVVVVTKENAAAAAAAVCRCCITTSPIDWVLLLLCILYSMYKVMRKGCEQRLENKSEQIVAVAVVANKNQYYY